MNPAIMECMVPFPKDGIPCPVCNRIQRDSSTFKTHARRVHKTLDVRTPTTCSICGRTFDTFRAGSAHYAKIHGAVNPKPPEPTIPSTPEACTFVEQLVHRSPPLTCSQEPLSTQELIVDLLRFSPTRPFTPISPRSTPEATPTVFTTASRSSSPDIAEPVSIHNRRSIRSPVEPDIAAFLQEVRQSTNISPPPVDTSQPSTPARRRLADLNRLRATLDDEDTSAMDTPPPPNQTSASPSIQQPPAVASPTLPPPEDLDEDPGTNTDSRLTDFHTHWQAIFSNHHPWDEFSNQCDLFAEAARTLAITLNQPQPRPRSENPPNSHQPRASRPTNSFNPAEARRIQGMYRNSKKRAARKILSNNTTSYTGTKQDAQDFFTNVFSSRPCDTDTLLHHLQRTVPRSEETSTHLATEISTSEVLAKLRTAANTSPGPDRVEYRHLKRVDPKCKILTLIFNRCLIEQNVPQSWKDACTILIHKKNDPTDPSNFRPIALMSCIYKLLMGTIGKRISSWAIQQDILSPEQKSARPSEGCYEHTFLLKSVIRDTRVNKRTTYVAWLDLRNAFGSIPHPAIRTTLQHIGIPESLISLICNVYTGATTTIRTSSESTDPIPIRSGVKQGCPLSAILFNLCIEVILRSIKEKATTLPRNQSLSFHNTLLSCLAYADDLVLVARHKDALQAYLDTASSIASILGLEFRPDKCATLSIINRKGEPTRIDPLVFNIHQAPIPTLSAEESYRYLGVPIGLIHNIDDLDSILPQLIDDLNAIKSSLLAPWQKLDAIRTFVQPGLTYALRAGDPKKQSLDDYRRSLIETLRHICDLPQRSTQAYFFASKCTGGLAFQDPKNEVDVQCIVQAIRMLTSADPATAAIARADLHAVVRRSTSSNPSANVITKYLSGCTENPLAHLYYTHSSLWSRCRSACRRLQITFHYSDTDEPCILSSDSDRIKAKAVTGFLHRLVQQQQAKKLLELPDQGKVAQSLATDHYANGSTWQYTGLNLRFKDWRFIHKARLNCLPTNAVKARWSNTSPSCRHCPETETLPHILNHCRPDLVNIRTRHNKIVTRITEAVRHGSITTDRTIAASGLSLRPDIVVEEDDRILIIDVTCPFDNGPDALEEAAETKRLKYQPLKEHCDTTGKHCEILPFVIGSLGSWHPTNELVLARLGMTTRYRNLFRKLCCTDSIQGSCDVYRLHMGWDHTAGS